MEWDGWGVWGSRCKLSHLEWISNGILLYGTENHIQSLGIDYDGKTQHWKSSVPY